MRPHQTRTTDRRSVRLSGLIAALGAVLCLPIFAPFFDRIWWPLELATHFRLQATLTLGFVTLLVLLLKQRRTAAVLSAVCLFGAAPLFGLYLPRDRGSAPTGPRVRLALLNVHTSNQEYARALECIRSLDADIVVLLETNRRWLTELASLEEEYPISLLEPRPDNFGLALFSRLPVEDLRTVVLGEAGVPSTLATLTIDGERLSLLATHPVPPGGRDGFRLRNEQLAAIPAWLRQLDDHVLLMGDLNCTPFSSYFVELTRDAELSNAAQGFGLQPTWPTDSLLLRIPIDHCLHSDGIWISRFEVGRAFGSDHFPLVVDCVLTSGT